MRKLAKIFRMSHHLFLINKFSTFLNPSLLSCKKIGFAYIYKYQQKHHSSFKKESKIELRGYLLLSIPIGTFFLGCWQVQRRQWKLDLIAELNEKTKLPPVSFPERFEDLDNMEFQKIKVVGKFDHDKEIYLGPRSLIVSEDSKQSGSIFSTSKSGYNVITPFKLSDGSCTILANRGWVPITNKDPASRLQGQVIEEIELTGVVRSHENRAPFVPKNRKSNDFFYRDLQAMSEKLDCSPIYIDVLESSPGGPKGGQTLVTLRNEHFSYLLTWYSLSIVTSVMWYWRFIKGKALM